MEEKRSYSQKKLWYYPLRGALAFVILFIIKSLTTPRLASYAGDSGLPAQLFYGFALLGIVLIYNSLVHTFSFYDSESFKKFKKRDAVSVRFFEELGIILRSKEFWLETLPVTLLSVLCSLLGGFYEAVFTVFPPEKAPAAAFTILPLAIVPLLLFITSLLCRYEIHRYFAELYRKGEENRVESKSRFILKMLVIFLMYPLLFPYAPYVLFLIVSFFGIVGTLISLLSVLGFVLAVIGLVLGVTGLLKWSAYRRKKAFLKRLSAKAKQLGEELHIFNKEEREVRSCDFILTSGGRSFACRIIPVINRQTPLYFTASDAYFLHRLGTKEHHTSIERHFEYSFPAEGQRLILPIGFPKKLFASEYGATRKLYSGDKIWNYIILEEHSFLGAFERECLDRTNSDS